MKQATAKSTWKTGQRVSGVYKGQPFTGTLRGDTRPTPDYRNVQFFVTLDKPITVFGAQRDMVICITGYDDILYLH